mgnify:CR=1 FL=1
MSDVKARVTTMHGQLIGYFIDPVVVCLCDDDYEIRGAFVDEHGRHYDRIEFNPEVVPYNVDLSQVPGLAVKALTKGYVQRGRQPIVITASRAQA